jgi:hypothetical protein
MTAEVFQRGTVTTRAAEARQAVRTLPVRLQPLPEESLDSWLEALAARTDATWGQILCALGIVGMHGNAASHRAARANVSLPAGQLDSMSYCTGVEPSLLQAMTLQPWIKDTSWQRPSVAILRVSGSRFCPKCLEDRGGRWRVWWRLRCGFLCPTHGCVLADTCRVCGGLQRTAPPRLNEVPMPGSCTRSVIQFGKTARCPEPLSSAPAACLDVGTAVVIQRDLLCVLRAGYTSGGIYGSLPVASTMFVQDLFTLGTWMLRCAQARDVAARISDLLWEQCENRTRRRFAQPLITDHGARMTCSSAAIDAAITCLAMPVLQADDTDIAAQRLQWLTSSMRRRGFSPTDSRNCWSGRHSRALDALRRTVLSSRRLP